MNIREYWWQFLDRNQNPWSREWFLRKQPPTSKILDVGCGNNSPRLTKSLLPACYYVGLDIEDYNQNSNDLADEYILVSPSDFAGEIDSRKNQFDVVISCHNLEHCEDRDGVLTAMIDAVKPGGSIYLAFPCETSIRFPKRKGSLNYFDDESHQFLPPNFDVVLEQLSVAGFVLDYASPRHRPILLFLVGLVQEPFSFFIGKKLSGTWALYGFESVIWARKR